MKFFFKQMLKVSAFYLEKQKSFILKKYYLSHSLSSKVFVTLSADPVWEGRLHKPQVATTVKRRFAPQTPSTNRRCAAAVLSAAPGERGAPAG